VRSVHRFLRITARERCLLVEAAFLVLTIRLGLWLFPFRAVRWAIDKAAPVTPVRSGCDPLSIERIAWAVERVSRYVPAATCLTQALAAQVLLRYQGYSPRLHIGVARGPGEPLVAHAWVESEGRVVVGGGRLQRYTPLLVLGEEAECAQRCDVTQNFSRGRR